VGVNCLSSPLDVHDAHDALDALDAHDTLDTQSIFALPSLSPKKIWEGEGEW